MSNHDDLDLAKPLSRWNAPHWAMRHGIAAALACDARWAVLEALFTFLPNVKPGKEAIERLTGLSHSTVWRGAKGLRAVGLISYDENKGGSGETNLYTIADIRRPEVVAAIIERLRKGSHSETVSKRNGSTVKRKGSHSETKRVSPRNKKGFVAKPEVHKEVPNPSSQEKSDRGSRAARPSPGAPHDDLAEGTPGTQAARSSDLAEDEMEDFVTSAGQEQPAYASPFVIPTSDVTHAPPSPAYSARITQNLETMTAYLRGGLTAVLSPGRPHPPSNVNWEVRMRGPDDCNPNAWFVPHFAGYYWWRVSAYRTAAKLPLTLPDWNRLCGDMRNLLNTTTNQHALQMIDGIVKYFDVIRWKLGPIGYNLLLDDTTLSHSGVRDLAFAIQQSMSEEELADLFRRFNESGMQTAA